MFYVFFESILAPLFVLIGLFGSKDKLRAGFYFFLYIKYIFLFNKKSQAVAGKMVLARQKGKGRRIYSLPPFFTFCVVLS